MMAWRVHAFGPPDVMQFERVSRPGPGPGEILVKVEAAGVSPWDGWIRAGKSALPQPLPLTLGTGSVIAGWDQGIVGMKTGGRRELIIPPDMAYGAEGRPPVIAPNETLVFVVDLIRIEGA